MSAAGVKAGGVGDRLFLVFPSKNLAVGGEGGMMTTRREDLAARMDALVNHGRRTARIARSGLEPSHVRSFRRHRAHPLKRLDDWLVRRRAIAERYRTTFEGLEGLVVPAVRPGTQHAWHQYCLLADDPAGLRAALEETLTHAFTTPPPFTGSKFTLIIPNSTPTFR